MTTQQDTQQDIPDTLPSQDPTSEMESDDTQEEVQFQESTEDTSAPSPDQNETPTDTQPPAQADTNGLPAQPSTAQPTQEQLQAQWQWEATAYQQQLAEQEQRTAQLEQQQVQQFMQHQAAQYRQSLEQQGFTPEDVQRNTMAFQQLQQQKLQIHQDRQRQQDQATMQDYERQAKWAFAQHYHKQFGVPIDELMKANSEPEMEVMGLKAQGAQSRQAQVPPQQRMDNNRPSPHASNNRDRQMDALEAKTGDWTNADFALYDKLKAQ